MCCSRTAKTENSLPPTIEICSAGRKLGAIYSITATAHPTGLLKRHLKTQQELKYQSAALTSAVQAGIGSSRMRYSECVRNIAVLPASRLGGSDFDCNHLAPCCLPGYSPAVMLEVAMSYPPLLCRGRKANLNIFVHAPSELTEVVGPIQIRSITARLRGTVTSRIGSFTRSDRMYRPIWHTTGSIFVDQEKFEVDSGMWQNCSTPDVPLSFQAFAVSQTYAIEVILGVSSNIRPEIQVRDITSRGSSKC